MSFDSLKSVVERSHWFILALLLLSHGGLYAATSIIGEAQPSTATERNNARLVARDGNGTWHVVYYDNGITHSISNDGGRTWSSPPHRLTEIGRNPSIAVNDAGQLHLVYKRGGIIAYEIVHRLYDGSWSEESSVYNSPQVPVSRPSLAVDSFGDLHCVWQRSGYGSTPNSEIWYRKRTGGSWGAAVNISNTYGSSEYPTLTLGDDGNVHIFWKDSGDDISNPKMVLYRKYTAAIGWDPDYTNVSNTSGNGSYATMDPCAVVDSQNDVHLVWKDSQPGNREIFYKKCTGGIWSETPTNLSGTDEASDTPIVNVDTNDNLTVVWAEKSDGIYYDVVSRSYSQGEGSWSATVNLSNTPGSDSRYPNMVSLSQPPLVCVWTEDDNSQYSIICMYDDLTSAVDTRGIPGPDIGAVLFPNHPNPFNPATTISYELPVDAVVSLAIHDASGHLVSIMVTGHRTAGIHHIIWHGMDEQNKAVSSGVYFSCLVVDGKRDTKKMVIIR